MRTELKTGAALLTAILFVTSIAMIRFFDRL